MSQPVAGGAGNRPGERGRRRAGLETGASPRSGPVPGPHAGLVPGPHAGPEPAAPATLQRLGFAAWTGCAENNGNYNDNGNENDNENENENDDRNDNIGISISIGYENYTARAHAGGGVSRLLHSREVMTIPISSSPPLSSS